MTTRRTAAFAAGLGAGYGLPRALVHAAPIVMRIGPLCRAVAPALAGVGRATHTALTFDDGPDAGSTPAILESLRAQKWNATFFMLGSMVQSNRSTARDVLAAGHEIGVHAHEHRGALTLTTRQVTEDLRRAIDVIDELTGVRPVWYRPPYGVLSAGVFEAARELGVRPVLWTAWGRDWRAKATPASVVADLCRGRLDGGTVLLHDSDCTSAPGSWRNTLAALPLLGQALDTRGLRAGPLGEHGVDGGPVRGRGDFP